MFGNDNRVNAAIPGNAADKKHRWVPLEDLRSAGATEKGRPLKLPGASSFVNGSVMKDEGHAGI